MFHVDARRGSQPDVHQLTAARPDRFHGPGLTVRLYASPIFSMVLTTFHKETEVAKNPLDVLASLSPEGPQSSFARPRPSRLKSLTPN
jgi:hypothetical protein